MCEHLFFPVLSVFLPLIEIGFHTTKCMLKLLKNKQIHWNQMSHSSVLLCQWASVNKGWHWVKVPSVWETLSAQQLHWEQPNYSSKDAGCSTVFCFFCFERQGSPAPISFLFSCVLPTGGPLVKPATPDPRARSHAHSPWLISRDRRRLAWAQRWLAELQTAWPGAEGPALPGGRESGWMEGWMDGCISLQTLISQSSFWWEDWCE